MKDDDYIDMDNRVIYKWFRSDLGLWETKMDYKGWFHYYRYSIRKGHILTEKTRLFKILKFPFKKPVYIKKAYTNWQDTEE